MVNIRYTPRHSPAAVKAARKADSAVAPAQGNQRRGASRMQIAIISGTALALLAIVTIFALQATPTDVKTCPRGTGALACSGTRASAANPPLTSVLSVQVLRGGRYSFDGPSAVADGGALWVTNTLGNSVTRVA